MEIAFDALPLLGRMTGIGYCEAGQVQALAKLCPELEFTLQYFYFLHGKTPAEAALQPFCTANLRTRGAFCSGFGYRLVSSFVPVPYQWFFGKKSGITHFFNYIVPPFVHGKTVVTVHDMVYRTYPETVRGRTKYMLKAGLVPSMQRADRIVTDSEFSKSEIIRFYPQFADKIRVVPCGVDHDRFHPERNEEKIADVRKHCGISGEYFLYLGTIEPRKNLERLMDAYSVFAASHENPAKLVLAGGKGWLYEGIFAKVQALGLEEQVIFTQYIPSEKLCALMSGALAFTFPSLYEGFGLPPLEAMACGTPVLVSDAASLPEVTGDAAVIVKADSVSSIAEGLHRLFTDAGLRERLSREGLKRAEGFTWEKSAGLLLDVYRELCPELREVPHA